MKNYRHSAREGEKRKLPLYKIMHSLLLLSIAATAGLLIWRFSNWGTFVDLQNLADDPDAKYQNGMDEIFPLLTGTEDASNDDGVTNILLFGNHPFSDDKDAPDSLANMIAERADATVYNCAVSGSCLSSHSYYFDPGTAPMDAYSFYWLITLAVTGASDSFYPKALEALGDKTPPEAREVYDILTSIDLNAIDIAVVMYDATDYLSFRNVYNQDNPTDVTCFSGNLAAGIEMLQEHYPNIRIIVMSPTFAYFNEGGKYVSGDERKVTYGNTLSSYVGQQGHAAVMRGITFVDNFYGSVTEENAPQYLSDNLHLNAAGRKVVADHLLYALTYFDKKK